MATLKEKSGRQCPRRYDGLVDNTEYPAAFVQHTSVAEYVSVLSDRLIGMVRHRTAEIYRSTLNSLLRFWDQRGYLTFYMFDPHLIVEYEAYLRDSGVCPNSSSFYMRNLRAIYNKAVDDGEAPRGNPFRRVYTGVDKTVKRAVTADVIRMIRDVDLTSAPTLGYARDLFMFSFYTRGMSFVDMAYLRKSDLRNGILSYRRHKTSQRLFVKWERPMQEILDRYPSSTSPYLLPIIRRNDIDPRRQYQNAVHLVNVKLKKLGEMLGLTIPLTTYVARHGWASIAHSRNIPIAIISEAMGHDSESTTRIYLAALDTTRVDNANSLVLSSI